MLVMCSILITVSLGNINFLNKMNVEGRVIKNNVGESKYLVDFTQGLKSITNFSGDKEDYKKMLVDKNDCVKE